MDKKPSIYQSIIQIKKEILRKGSEKEEDEMMLDGYGTSNNNCNKKKKPKKKKKKSSSGKKKMAAEQTSAAKSIQEWVFPESSVPPVDDFQVPRSHRLAEPLIFELHSHSICSDGFLSPPVLVERAHRNGVSP